MGKLQQNIGALNEGDRLREALSRCEVALVTLTPEHARQLLADLAEAERIIAALQATGADVRAEQLRLETIRTRLLSRARPFVQALGGVRAYRELRAQAAPLTPTLPWWRLDDVLAEQRRARWKRAAGALVVIAIFAGIIYALREVLFPPNPAADAIAAAQRALQEGDANAALAAIEAGLAQAPNHPQLLIWRGVLVETQDPTAAADAFARAQVQLGADDFHIERAQVRLIMGEAAHAEAELSELIARNPELPVAYLVRAAAYEAQRRYDLAARDLERAAEVAQRLGDDIAFATARVRLGLLLQAQSGLLAATPSPEMR
ncbi:MAG: hypothetical protein NZL91_08110 [Thermoflexales bacterium]|nr:hypothetical protein [Thermoflexales bacterium]MDW8292674.1 hypothetical protein [Anaerolineae bacterium]